VNLPGQFSGHSAASITHQTPALKSVLRPPPCGLSSTRCHAGVHLPVRISETKSNEHVSIAGSRGTRDTSRAPSRWSDPELAHVGSAVPYSRPPCSQSGHTRRRHQRCLPVLSEHSSPLASRRPQKPQLAPPLRLVARGAALPGSTTSPPPPAVDARQVSACACFLPRPLRFLHDVWGASFL
jgi:hypothetical protein